MNFDTRDRSAHVDDPLMTALITDVHSDTFKLLPKRYPLVILAFIGLLFLGLFIAIGLHPIVGVVVFGVPSAILAVWVTGQIRHEFMRQFAERNHFIYAEKADSGRITGWFTEYGHSHIFQDLVIGHYSEREINLGNYQYTTGAGKHQQTHTLTVCKILFPYSVPHLYLNCHAGVGSLDFSHPRGLELITLPDEIGKKWHLLAQDDFQIEALQIFNPTILAEVNERWRGFELEYKDKEVYVISEHIINTKDELERFFNLIKYVIDTTDPILKRIEGSTKAIKEQRKS